MARRSEAEIPKEHQRLSNGAMSGIPAIVISGFDDPVLRRERHQARRRIQLSKSNSDRDSRPYGRLCACPIRRNAPAGTARSAARPMVIVTRSTTYRSWAPLHAADGTTRVWSPATALAASSRSPPTVGFPWRTRRRALRAWSRTVLCVGRYGVSTRRQRFSPGVSRSRHRWYSGLSTLAPPVAR